MINHVVEGVKVITNNDHHRLCQVRHSGFTGVPSHIILSNALLVVLSKEECQHIYPRK